MRRLQIVIIGLALGSLGGRVWADTNSSLVLDYDTQAKGCPDAGRFADEVSSKLGFVPWNEQGLSTLRIRIRTEGSELVGTLELPDGSSKILRDSTCPPLFAALTTAASVALDRESAPSNVRKPVVVPTASYVQPSPLQLAKVHIRADKPGMTVSVISDHISVSGPGGGAEGHSEREVCLLPCSFELNPGIHEIVVRGRGGAALRKYELSAGDTFLVAEPGSNALALGGYALVMGGALTILYGVFAGLPEFGELDSGTRWALGLSGAGVAGLGFGMTAWGQSSLEEDTNPLPARTISYTGAF